MTTNTPEDRRQHPRAPIVRTCKVRPVGALRFDGGTTRDASWGGVAVTVHTARRFTQGDKVELIIAWEGESVATAPATTARVSRVIETARGEQSLALDFMREEAATGDIAAA